MLKIIVGGYWVIALIVFLVWFRIFWNDETTAKNDFFSWMVLIIGASFWVVALPLAILELAIKSSSTKD
ncbi:hypothetical protein [Crocosphaera sp. Alani8]|uniref:hypothetical protein n=1 Tax=Crocosphaera sp. Alani8 TaxID=3038952 RepID=UPI00313E3754